MTSSPSKPRIWLRRLLKTAGILALLLVTLLVVTIIVNRFDEKIDKDTQAWLDYPAPTAPSSADTQNGYLALLALDARADKPLAAAAEVVRQEKVLFAASRQPQRAIPDYSEVRTRLLKPSDLRISAGDCKDKCYAYILANRDKLARLAEKHADLLRRYEAMLDSPAYAEDVPRDPRAPYPNHSLADGLGLLYLGNVVSTLEKGDTQTAYRAWARHQRFWQKAASGSATLLGEMRAVAQLERNQALLADMLKAHPQGSAIAKQHALPLLAQQPRLASLAARSMVMEFQMQAYVFTDMIHQFSLFSSDELQPARLYDRLALLFYQRNASLNLLHRLHQDDLEQNNLARDPMIPQVDGGASEQGKATCARPGWRFVVNPLGKYLLCQQASYDLSRYHQRAAKADVAAKVLEQSIQAMR